jgi:excinuclease ABC subunit C
VNLKSLPHAPGVYLFKNNRQKVIYVGKAIDLRNRVSSYFSSGARKGSLRSANLRGDFQPNPKLLPRTTLLVRDIKDFDHIRVESELEALILEANLIKKYRPYYNVRLKDDKDYLYIKITREDFPTVVLARTRDLTSAKRYFGPFPNSSAARTTYKLLRRLFPFRTCQPNQGRACFYYHLGQCLGVCIGQIDQKTYQVMIRHLIHFLEGKKETVIQGLTWDMNNASRELKYERAAQIKRQIESIHYVTQQTRLIDRYIENPNLVEDLREQALRDLAEAINLSGRHLTRLEAYDNSNIQGQQAVTSMVVFTGGEPDPSQYRKFRIKTVGGIDDYAYFREVLRRRFKRLKVSPNQKFNLRDRKFMDVNSDESFEAVPDLLVIDGGRGQVAAAQGVLLEMNLPLPIIGLAKRLEEVYLPGQAKPLRLAKGSEALKLLQHIRDEAHRFALAYHRKLRNRALLPDTLPTS